MHNFLCTFWVHIHCPYSPIVLWNHAIYEIRCKNFLSISLERCMTLNTAYITHEAPCRPMEEKCNFYASTVLNKTDVLDCENPPKNCKEWPLKLRALIFFKVNFWMKKLDEILFELYSNMSDGNLLFLAECRSVLFFSDIQGICQRNQL